MYNQTFSYIVDRVLDKSQKLSMKVQTINAVNDFLRETHRKYELSKDLIYEDFSVNIDENQIYKMPPEILISTRNQPRVHKIYKCNGNVLIPRVESYHRGKNRYTHFWYEDFKGIHVFGTPECRVLKSYLPKHRKYYGANSDKEPCKYDYDLDKWVYLDDVTQTYKETLNDEDLEFKKYDAVTEWLIQDYPKFVEYGALVSLYNNLKDPAGVVVYNEFKEHENVFAFSEANR